jgi:hypothetical protein
MSDESRDYGFRKKTNPIIIDNDDEDDFFPSIINS